MSTTSKTLRGLLAGGLLAIGAASVIALPVAGASPCNQTVGNSIDAYLQRHPDLHRQLQASSEAEGGGPNIIDYLYRHPDLRQHLIDLSQQCAP